MGSRRWYSTRTTSFSVPLALTTAARGPRGATPSCCNPTAPTRERPTKLCSESTRSSFDVALIAGALGVLFWAFGWRTAAVAAVFLGTQAPAELEWTGGALLRFDWLFLVVLALALMRKGRHFWGGLALGWAGLLRLFPLLFWAGPAVLMLRDLVCRRQVQGPHRRLLLGGLCAALVLLPAGAIASGPAAYFDFGQHITMHAQTPISNHMSLRTLFSYAPEARESIVDQRPVVGASDAWTTARLRRLEANRFWFLAAGGALLILFAWSVWRLPTTWIAVVLSLLPIVVLTDPSCYYFSIFMIAALLGRARRSLEVAAVGVASIGQLLVLQLPGTELPYVWLAGLYVVFATVMALMFARPPWGPGGRARRGKSPSTLLAWQRI